MKAKVYLNQPLTQDRYGLHFDRGEAYTDNEYLIKKLQSKGVKVEIIKEEKTVDEMSVAELKKYAIEKNIEIPSNIRSKTDIIEFIKNYKEDDGKLENPPKDDGEDENTDTNSNNVDGEDNNEEDDGEEQKIE